MEALQDRAPRRPPEGRADGPGHGRPETEPPRSSLEAVSNLLPSLRKTDVARLAQEGWVALETVLTELQVRELIPRLKELGAEGIIEISLEQSDRVTDTRDPPDPNRGSRRPKRRLLLNFN